jgi:hypothetical protein
MTLTKEQKNALKNGETLILRNKVICLLYGLVNGDIST